MSVTFSQRSNTFSGGRRFSASRILRVLLYLWLLVPAACATPRLQDPGTAPQPPRLLSYAAVMEDGYRLPLHRWGDPDAAHAVVLALHGLNDYGNAYAGLGRYLAGRGVLVYAYDQRGFGASAQRGIWAGETRMLADLRTLVGLLRERYPRLPLYLIGESMGGAVLLAGASDLPGVAGTVLIAPAVWSRDSMPPLQRGLLSAAVATAPGLKLSGRGLGIRPTDNIPAWRAFSADPLVIKETRVDALWGITNLMDRAARAETVGTAAPSLILYGEHDQIIPRRAFCSLLDNLDGERPAPRLGIYPRGWHMLTRDLQGAWVLADIAAWIDDPEAPLPSGKEASRNGAVVKQLCSAD